MTHLTTPGTPTQALVQALHAETNLVTVLRQALEDQRSGVAEDNPSQVEEATLSIARTVLALGEVRRQRFGLVDAVLGSTEGTLEAVIASLPPESRPMLREVQETLRRTSRAAAQDAAITQLVLRRALQAGDAMLQQLFAMRVPDGATDPAPEGVILDRTA